MKTFSLSEKRLFAQQMRENPTPAEAKLWELIQRGQLGYKFRRQELLQGFILDFYCPVARTGVEVDGSAHLHREKAHQDEIRHRVMMRRGVRLMHFSAVEVLAFPEKAAAQIKTICEFQREAILLGSLKGVGVDSAFRAPMNTPILKASNSRLQDYSGHYPPKPASLEAAPLTEKLCISGHEAEKLVEKISRCTRQKSFPFPENDNRPIFEKVNSQRSQLQAWLKGKERA